MPLLGELLRSDPSKITFEGKKPPVIGEVPPHTYGMLDATRNLELLDEAREHITVDQGTNGVVFAEKPIDRSELLRREMQSVSNLYNIPTSGGMDDSAVWKMPRRTTEPSRAHITLQFQDPSNAEIKAAKREAKSRERLASQGDIYVAAPFQPTVETSSTTVKVTGKKIKKIEVRGKEMKLPKDPNGRVAGVKASTAGVTGRFIF